MRETHPEFTFAPLHRVVETRRPIVYERETFFTLVNLILLAGSFWAGWMIGHLVHGWLA